MDDFELEGPLKWIVSLLILAEISVCWAVFTPLYGLIIGVIIAAAIIGLVSLLPLHWRA